MHKITPTKPSDGGKPPESSQPPHCVCENDKSSITSIVCRICYDGEKDEPIITPCRCRGTVAYVHRTCLETWLAESNTTSCELCHYVYNTERTPKYTARQSIWRWVRFQPHNVGFHVRGLRSDILACTILTPLAIVVTYVCLFSADYYNQKKFANIPAAKWTSVSLLVMISIMLMGYYLWVYMVVRYHGRVWFYCWQRDCIVRYIPPSLQNICCHVEREDHQAPNNDGGLNNGAPNSGAPTNGENPRNGDNVQINIEEQEENSQQSDGVALNDVVTSGPTSNVEENRDSTININDTSV